MVFVGDSTTRQIFWAAARKLDSNWVADRRGEQEPLGDLELDVEGARLRFVWDPWLNSTTLSQELKMYVEHNSPSRGGQVPSSGKRRQALLLLGGGLWHARHLQDNYLTTYKLAVDRATAAASVARSKFDIQNGGDDGVGNQLFFAPVFEPLYDQLSPSRRVTITPNKIQAMNRHLLFQSQRGLNVPWVFQNMTAGYPEIVGLSGMHVTNSVAEKMADVVINYRCNAKLARTEGFPYNQTCCSAYRPFNLITAVGAILCAFLLGVAGLKRLSPSTVDRFARSTMLDVLAVLALVVSYCFVADRTHILDKFPKEFDNLDFRVMLVVGVGVCLFNIKSIASAPAHTPPDDGPDGSKSVRKAKFLPREQSDEFKGWMQIYMLVYAYTGASSEIDFYKVFRILFALYLFLSGYGHTKYFLRRKDYSLQRVFSVLLRLNTLPVLLSFFMSRPYTSYFFAPLVSFWFLVVYATLRIGYQWNGLGLVLAGKIGVSALLVTGFVYLEGLLEGCAAMFGLVFGAEVDAEEWRFYLSNDGLVVFVAMLVAVMKTPRAGAPQPSKWLLTLWRCVLPAFALLAIPVFWIPMSRLRSQDEYNWWFSYTGWLPALFFVVVRNATPFLRTHYSDSFAKLGQISLELYLVAQHTWLAGDGEGLLRAGFPEGDGSLLKDGWRDVCVLSVVLVWLAWEAHSATQATTAWVMGAVQQQQQQEQQQQEGLELPVWDGAGPQPAEGPRGEGVVVAGLRVPGVGLRLVGIGAAIWIASLVER
jgi:hypothetical protein